MEAHGSESGLSPVMKTTATFLLAGFGLLVLGAAVQPRFKAAKVQPEAERILFPELSDASKAASLQIVRYDDALATLRDFKVVQSGGVWVLPSHENYPADAKEQLAAAATELVDLKSLDVVSQSPAEHETFGVIEPDPEKLKPGMTGVGELIEVRDGSGGKLARLVVGKEAKRTGGGPAVGGRTLRYVRKAGQDPVYLVELDLTKFSTDFSQWIEKDLLKLSPWDVRKVVLDDYSLAAVESGGRLRVEQQRKNLIDLAYDDKDAKWSLVKLESFDPSNASAKGKEQKLADTEEVASTKLNDLRNALGDLKIIDVARKPAGLSAELKAEESFTGDPAAVASLQQRGFLPLRSGEILSTDGETIVGMKNGVEYVLRFGATTSVATAGKDDAAKDEGAKDGGADTKGDDTAETAGRYVLVMARFNESLLEKPKLEPVPDAPAEKNAEPAKTEPAKEGTGRLDGDSRFRLVALLADDDAKKPSAGAEAPATEAKKEPSAADALEAADEAEAKMQAAIEERRRVERENRRKQDEYDDQVKAAKKKVRELNNRFADWYYVVSDKEYAKIHLGRTDVVKPKEKADEAKDAAKP